MSFDASLPDLINENIRNAVAELNKPGLGAAGYQAPAASAVLPFILSEVSFSGGSSVETTEYPFFGGWSSEALNEKPQSIKIKGAIGGANVLSRRNDILNALRVATSDDSPGYIVLPSWGRFPVVVVDWDVSETMDKQGLFPLSLTFTRAGQSAASRQTTTTAGKDLATARTALQTRAISVFADELTSERLSATAIAAGFGAINAKLLAVIGRIQSAQSALNTVTNSVLAVTNLIDQGISAPFALATAFFAAADAIVAAALGTANEIASVFDDADSAEGAERNARNVALAFLANATFTLDIQVATPKGEATRAALQNLYRTASFFAASGIVPSIPEISYDKFKDLYQLLRDLEEAIDRDDPDIATACTDVRIAVSDRLRSLELYHERTARFPVRQPMLAAAASLGLSYDRFRALNPSIRDEFAVIGEVSYV